MRLPGEIAESAEVPNGEPSERRAVRGEWVPLALDFAEGVVAAGAVAASSTVVVSDTVSRKGEREFVMVAGDTIVMERVTGVCATGVLAAVAVAGVIVAVGVAALLDLALRPAGVVSLVCWSRTSEKLCEESSDGAGAGGLVAAPLLE